MTRTQTNRRSSTIRLMWAGLDAVIWFVAVYAATFFRYDFHLGNTFALGTLLVAGAAALLQVVIGHLAGPYAVGHTRGSFEEAVDIAKTVFAVGAIILVWALLANPIVVPRSVPITAAAIALVVMLAARFVKRAWDTRSAVRMTRENRALIFGAGSAGRQLVRSIIEDPHNAYEPVAFLDDSPSKSRLVIDGVRVRGDRDQVEYLARKLDATHLIVALPDADSSLLRDLSKRADNAGLKTLVLPPLAQIVDGRAGVKDIRDINLQDLLGRRPIQLDQQAIAEQITGKRVLVTGAGGSIGSELCRQIAKFGPARLLMLERDESTLQATQISLQGHGLLDSDDLVLCDIRDPEGLREVFQTHRPQVVFHAAALKHLPMLEAYPLEAFKSNVLGTLNVLTAARDAGVETFVNISTDKAANPTSVLGYSKRLAERLTADFAAQESTGRYMSVRFGNVLGSRGSVIPAFTAQIRRGGPVTVTHPDVVRYFMLIPEACQLVMQAAAMGRDGEVMVLDMGEPVKIVDVAQRLIAMSGRREVEIVYTGLRPGEKMSEELFKPGEDSRQTAHPLVAAVDVPTIDRGLVQGLQLDDVDQGRAWMKSEATYDLDVVPESDFVAGELKDATALVDAAHPRKEH